MTISTARHDAFDRHGPAVSLGDDRPDAEFETTLPAQTAREARGRWFDLCFRLIILALAALWLLTPPAGGGHGAVDLEALATTR